MINDKKIVVVMPAFNAEKTLKRTLDEVPPIVDDIVLVDDCSSDNTAALAKNLGISHVIVHDRNRGYGGNQKTCYDTALSLGADIVVMVHPDYQYTPKLITAICSIIAYGVYPVVLGSRILGKGAIKGGMPRIKYVANRLLTLFQNILMGQKLSEYHTGYRAFSREVLENINYSADSEDFIFDNQMLAQVFYKGYEIGEVTCPTRYFGEASSINLKRSTVYGFGVLGVSVRYRLAKWGLVKPGYLA
ncbi:MAG: glycosyltransferase family 2 protein [Bacteroidales bacterium]|nr:glycosyltransferase family 2 protein [Bacteroidales bacterium]